jgi:hypothetical protein
VYGKWNSGISKRRHRSLGNDVFACLEDSAGESAQKKAKGLCLRVLVGKANHDHRLPPSAAWNLASS